MDQQASNKNDNWSDKLPEWFKQGIPTAESLEQMRRISDRGVNTVCVSAKCPNSGKCFNERRLTFMILGSICTRSCRFCAVDKSRDQLVKVDEDEPRRIAQIINELGINYAVITSVSRDDLPDGGARQFFLTIQAIRKNCPDVKIEVLIPDFRGQTDSLKILAQAKPDVIGHNLETVNRLYPRLRPEADYRLSLRILASFKEWDDNIVTKSSLMLGFSETWDELVQAINDLKQVGCDILTLGQYLAPSASHEPVREFIKPERFSEYRQVALKIGFKAVLAGPLVRSSYMAEKVFQEAAYV
jgi:lipoyl synthase